VRLKDKTGKELWKARTNHEGKANLFVDGFEKNEGPFTIEVQAASLVKNVSCEQIDWLKPLTIQFDAGKKPESLNILDLMFVVDTTGSMSDELEYLKVELQDILKEIRKTNKKDLRVRISCNFYRDHGDEYVLRFFPFTENIDTALSQIQAQRADEGGDEEEAVEEALEKARGHDWSPQARARLLFLVLDAPMHNHEAKLKAMKETLLQTAAQGIRIIPVVGSRGKNPTAEFFFRFLAVATGGTYVFLTDHSGIGETHMKPTVGKYEIEFLNKLLIKIINRYLEE
jgi:hypothetical protein